MNSRTDPAGRSEVAAEIPNGPGAAAILSAAVGCAMLGVLAVAGDASARMNALLNFYGPTGALSGVTTVAIVVWLAVWSVLFRLWRKKNVALGKVNAAAFVLLAVGFLLTFPPFMDLIQGK